MRSLSVRLVLFLIVPFVLLLPLAMFVQYRVALLPVLESLDRSLEEVALAVAATVRTVDGKVEATLPLDRMGQEESLSISVVDGDGRVVAGDPQLGRPRPPIAAGETVHFAATARTDMRVAAHGVTCGTATCQVRVGMSMREVESIERRLLLGSMADAVMLLASIGIAMWFGALATLAPLRDLREQLATRSFNEQSPLVVRNPPDEIVPIIESINAMLVRIKRSAEGIQTFVGATAHQLRTPLATLTTQIELAIRQSRDAARDEAMLLGLKQAVDRMSRLTHQLLALARSDPTAGTALSFGRVDVREIALAAGSASIRNADERGIDLGFDAQSAWVLGHAQLLEEAVANLIDNSIRYGATFVTVKTGVVDGRVELQIEDNGRGIAPQDREGVFRPFVRPPGSTGDGSGLGLAIVRQIARLHGGEVELRPSEVGLTVVVILPAVPEPPSSAG